METLQIHSPPSINMSTTPPQSPPIPYRSSRWPARFLIATGIGHTIVGFLTDGVRIPFLQAIRSGYINQFSFSQSPAHSNSYWFFIAGVNMILRARLMDWYLFPDLPSLPSSSGVDDNTLIQNEAESEKQALIRRQQRSNDHSDRKIPRELGYWFVGIAVTGALAMPKSGFYLLGIQGLAIIFSE